MSPSRSRGGGAHVDQLALRLIEYVSSQNNPIGWGVLSASAFFEYVFPPFPGDTVTLFGAFLITSRGWSFVAVFGAVLLGSAAGAMADFALGRWLRRREATHPARHPKARAQIDRLVARFKRHGEVFIVINRFLPGVRALFFVAAGMADLRPRRVLLWSLVSAALWNLLLIAVGSSVGANFDRLRAFFATYAKIVWITLGAIAAIWLVRVVVRRITAR